MSVALLLIGDRRRSASPAPPSPPRPRPRRRRARSPPVEPPLARSSPPPRRDQVADRPPLGDALADATSTRPRSPASRRSPPAARRPAARARPRPSSRVDPRALGDPQPRQLEHPLRAAPALEPRRDVGAHEPDELLVGPLARQRLQRTNAYDGSSRAPSPVRRLEALHLRRSAAQRAPSPASPSAPGLAVDLACAAHSRRGRAAPAPGRAAPPPPARAPGARRAAG